MDYSFDVNFVDEASREVITKDFVLEEPHEYQEGYWYRKGRVGRVELCSYFNPYTEAFMYDWRGPVTERQVRRLGLKDCGLELGEDILWTGQQLLGGARREVMRRGIAGMLKPGSPLREIIEQFNEEEIAVFPLLREGGEMDLPAILFNELGIDVGTVIWTDAHHQPDKSVLLGRKSEIEIFKADELTPQQRKRFRLAIIPDGLAGAANILKTFRKIDEEGFTRLERREVIPSLSSAEGPARADEYDSNIPTGISGFDPFLVAQGQESYWCAHPEEEERHINPGAEKRYRILWGVREVDRGGEIETEEVSKGLCAAILWSEILDMPEVVVEDMERMHLYPDRGVTMAMVMEQRNWEGIPREQWPGPLEELLAERW